MATPNSPNRPNTLAWPLTLGAFLLLLGAGLGLYRYHVGPSPDLAVGPPPTDAPLAFSFSLNDPLDAAAAKPAVALHNVEYDIIDGTRVLKIQLVASGDEVYVDAVTGKFIRTATPSVLAAPGGGGAKFAAPHAPMM